jgi:hypothetical protein
MIKNILKWACFSVIASFVFETFIFNGNEDKEPLNLATETNILDFSRSIAGEWTQFCFFPPYTFNKAASKGLGFAWDLEKKSDIYLQDDISLLVFADNEQVLRYDEVKRDEIDFSALGQGCVSHAQAKVDISDKDNPVLFTRN